MLNGMVRKSFTIAINKFQYDEQKAGMLCPAFSFLDNKGKGVKPKKSLYINENPPLRACPTAGYEGVKGVSLSPSHIMHNNYPQYLHP